MRYIPINCIKPGLVIGKTLFNHTGQVLLTEGSTVKENYIAKIKTLGVKGIFVEDPISCDIDVYNAVSEELRQESVKSIRKLFDYAEKSGQRAQTARSFTKQVQMIMHTVENIIEDVLSHAEVINNVMDIKVFDEYTYYHCTNVTVLSVLVGIELEMSEDELKTLGMCAILHDVGKVFIDSEILNKEGALTEEELALIRSHSEEGFKYIRERQSIDAVIAQGVLDHHEKFDGTGYPSGKKGKKISELGRIISVADVYDALTSDRVYRKAWSPAEAIEYIMAGTGTAFDPKVVSAFAKKVDPYPVGTAVFLSNGNIGIVSEIEPHFPTRPRLRIFMEQGKQVAPYEISLANDINCLNITILSMADV